ncbi:hypothetical protein Tco_0948579 [Tanacetum coccineum]
MPPKRNCISAATIEQLITQCVADALLTYEANRNSRNGNGNGNDIGNGSHDSGDSNRRPLHTARGCITTTTPRPTPLSTTPRVGVFTPFVIISDSDDEITTLPMRPAPPSPDHTPALYVYPLDSGDDSSN